jgi:hypothetical protein
MMKSDLVWRWGWWRFPTASEIRWSSAAAMVKTLISWHMWHRRWPVLLIPIACRGKSPRSPVFPTAFAESCSGEDWHDNAHRAYSGEAKPSGLVALPMPSKNDLGHCKDLPANCKQDACPVGVPTSFQLLQTASDQVKGDLAPQARKLHRWDKKW